MNSYGQIFLDSIVSSLATTVEESEPFDAHVREAPGTLKSLVSFCPINRILVCPADLPQRRTVSQRMIKDRIVVKHVKLSRMLA